MQTRILWRERGPIGKGYIQKLNASLLECSVPISTKDYILGAFVPILRLSLIQSLWFPCYSCLPSKQVPHVVAAPSTHTTAVQPNCTHPVASERVPTVYSSGVQKTSILWKYCYCYIMLYIRRSSELMSMGRCRTNDSSLTNTDLIWESSNVCIVFVGVRGNHKTLSHWVGVFLCFLRGFGLPPVANNLKYLATGNRFRDQHTTKGIQES